jgi:TfoX/Sxy family transcriptional regulator of competence genes
MKIPKARPESVELLKSLLPQDDRIKTRPMFGNLAAFVNGNLFVGLFGEDIFARLSPEDEKALLKIDGASSS